ncbi:receptor-like protein kinase FERONIA [Jatropha curcas]|uniref:receptor-like protein kinase FERONIA n=1 Tax=Jatropha curcas TaxID=180498 RepID=UPI0018961373|nr:receptor-like protein kinase FERONIA [Jatropha curcas]
MHAPPPVSSPHFSSFSHKMRKTNNKYLPLQIPSISAVLYFFLLLHQLTILTAGDSPSPLIGNITIDCGSTSAPTAEGGRIWTADTDSKFSLLDPTNASITSPAPKNPTSGDQVPYITARLSRSDFTYTLPVTPGPKFIRLYFYPASYVSFSSSTAFFSVKAGGFTLLSNFSAALYAQAHNFDTFVKEFSLNVEDGQMLNVTFSPTPSMTGAYAFINGLEIVSIPSNLLYNATGDPEIKFLDRSDLGSLGSNTALEVTYRINVGGGDVSPLKDNGMFRSWTADDEYLTIAKPSAILYNLTLHLKYGDLNNIARYGAPAEVYKTARSMGDNKSTNEKYNLTWTFQLDSNFTYLFRLHFCEFQSPITEIEDRVFWIYINNQTADSADVIKWSGGNGFPIFKDYGVAIEPQGNKKVQNVSVALHPRVALTLYSDAILNGIEIFKMSNIDNSLAGPNPDVNLTSAHTTETNGPTSSNSSNNGTKIGAVIGGTVSGLAILSLLLFLIGRRRRLGVKDRGNGAASWLGPFSISSTKTQSSSTLPADVCRRFSLSEIIDATNNFDNLFIIGVGGFGNVYKGLINNGASTVAIKRLNPGSEQGAHEFKTEIEMLSQLRHLHLVSLIGYCYEDNEMILVYDYMARGTLRDHLYKTDNPPLPWTQRLEICIGAARGLNYLHSGASNTIIHRDVKTTNILLDEKWVAKVSDFGLSKIGPNSMSKPHISTVVKGSFGYLDPEYFRLQRLTEKSDVYSFGVVLCEVISARPPVNRSTVDNPASLAEWARRSYRKGNFDEIVDPYLHGKILPDCLRKFAEVAVSCLHENGMDRPSMGDVVWGLEFALQLQETATKQGELQTGSYIDMESPLKGSSVADSSDDLFSSGSELVIGSRLSGMTLISSSDEQSFISNNSEQVMSGAVFSEIINPRAR